MWLLHFTCVAHFRLYLAKLTCNISVRDALSLCVAGCHFSGANIEVGQLAGEPGGAAKLDAACPRHIVDGVTLGEY